MFLALSSFNILSSCIFFIFYTGHSDSMASFNLNIIAIYIFYHFSLYPASIYCLLVSFSSFILGTLILWPLLISILLPHTFSNVSRFIQFRYIVFLYLFHLLYWAL